MRSLWSQLRHQYSNKMAIEIKVGQIWEVTGDNFHTSGKDNKHKRPVLIAKGEKIEIRYPYAWHFRTTDNFYFHAEPEMILKKCTLVGVIMERIRFGNQASLEEILRLKLYEPEVNKKD